MNNDNSNKDNINIQNEKKEEDIFDYININDAIYYQSILNNNENEIINEPIE